MQGTGKEDLMPTNDLTTDLDFLRELCAAPAPTGFEAPAQEVLRRRLQGTAEPQSDPLGNLWADAPAEGAPHVVVTGHNDQIGLIVTYVDDKGFVYFDKIGGVDPQLLPGRHLVVNTAKGPVHGVVGRRPTHIIPKEERGKAAGDRRAVARHRRGLQGGGARAGGHRRRHHLRGAVRGARQPALRLAGLRQPRRGLRGLPRPRALRAAARRRPS